MALAPAKEKGPEREKEEETKKQRAVSFELAGATALGLTQHLMHIVRPPCRYSYAVRDDAGAVQHQSVTAPSLHRRINDSSHRL